MANKEIRIALISNGVKQYELAYALKISESHISRKLRRELPEDEKKEIIATIEKLANGGI